MKKLFRLFPLLLAIVLLAAFAVRTLFPCELHYSAESAPLLLGELPGLQKKFTPVEESLLEEGGASAAGRGDWVMLVCESSDMEELLSPAAALADSADEVLLLSLVPGEGGVIESSRVYRYSEQTGSGSWSLVAFGSGENKVRSLDNLRGGSLSAMLLITAGMLLIAQIPVSAVCRRRDRRADRCAPAPGAGPVPPGDGPFSGEGPGAIPPMEHHPQFPVVKCACGMLMLLSAAGLILLGWVFFSGAFTSDPAGLLLAAVMCLVLMTFSLTTLASIRRGEPSRGRNFGIVALTLVLMVFLALVAYSVFF